MKTLVLALFLAACSGDSSTPMPDAAPAGSNLPFGATCNIPSDSSTECASGVCTDSFDQLPHPVCSQKCTVLGGTDTTCPQGPSAQKCNMKGYCKP
jgi:hypothetical protein